MFGRRRYVTRTEFCSAIAALDERIELMATQADVDALTAQIGTVASDLAAAKATLQAEIDKLAAGNPSLDLTGLQAAVAPLDETVQQLGALTPTPPATP